MPDYDDAGFDAWEGRLGAARELRARRRRTFARFERQQLRAQRWFPIVRITTFYAEERCRSDPKPDPATLEEHRHAAYEHMARALLGGRVFVDVRTKRSQLLFLDPAGSLGAHRLTADHLERFLNTHPAPVVWRQVLAQCWTPHALAREVMDELGLAPPDSWFPAAATPAPVSPPAKLRKKPISNRDLRAWWRGYVAQHSNPDLRPPKEAQRAAAAAAFPANAAPTEKAMQGLRADQATPVEWREAGRRPSRARNRIAESK